MDPRVKKAAFILPALVLGLILGVLVAGTLRIGSWFDGPDPESITTASLQSVREQQRLTAFSARFVSVVTSSQKRFGLTSQKTLIMPGNVRYEVDLARLRQKDLRWDEGTKTLAISLPPLEISGPEIDLTQVREYGGDGLLATLTDAEDRLDASNRQAGQQELMRQARQPMTMRLARDAAKKAVARSFAMPLRAAGIEANVEVRFADEGRQEPSYLDRSRRMEDVLKERQQAR
jgi:hypothetical protein